MEYKHKFKFKTERGTQKTPYHCEPDSDPTRYKISWRKIDGFGEDDFSTYPVDCVERYIQQGSWVIQECNGQDAKGNPLNFTKADLKPFMRVVQRNGKTLLVMEKDGEVFTAFVDGFNIVDDNLMYPDPYRDYQGKCGSDILEVYNAPSGKGYLLNTKEKGNLLWKRVEAPIKTEQEIAIENLEASIKESQDKLERLKKTL